MWESGVGCGVLGLSEVVASARLSTELAQECGTAASDVSMDENRRTTEAPPIATRKHTQTAERKVSARGTHGEKEIRTPG